MICATNNGLDCSCDQYTATDGPDGLVDYPTGFMVMVTRCIGLIITLCRPFSVRTLVFRTYPKHSTLEYLNWISSTHDYV
jgi:hypothetical protein